MLQHSLKVVRPDHKTMIPRKCVFHLGKVYQNQESTPHTFLQIPFRKSHRKNIPNSCPSHSMEITNEVEKLEDNLLAVSTFKCLQWFLVKLIVEDRKHNA